MNATPRLLTAGQVAEILHVCKKTLERWRRQDKGPRALDMEGEVRYRLADVESYLRTLPRAKLRK